MLKCNINVFNDSKTDHRPQRQHLMTREYSTKLKYMNSAVIVLNHEEYCACVHSIKQCTKPLTSRI